MYDWLVVEVDSKLILLERVEAKECFSVQKYINNVVEAGDREK